MSEYWDIYDMNRNKTTRTHLRGEPIPDGDYHLVAAAVRETREETGILLEPQELILLEQERRLHSFMDTFVVFRDVADSEIVMQPEEVVDFCWVDEEGYRRMEEQGILYPALKNFYETYRPMLQRARASSRS